VKKRVRQTGGEPTLPLTVLRAEDLSDRQVRGIQLHERAEKSNGLVTLLNDETTIYWGGRDHAYRVTRELRNVRGTLKLEYRCSCGDFRKNGRIDCLHCFAERLRRGEVIVEGAISGERHATAGGGRRPPRKRYAADGRAMRTVQRAARVALGDRIPALVADLKRAYDLNPKADDDDPEPPTGKGQPASSRATALVLKVCNGLSADEMQSVYRRHIENGELRLKGVPHQNTLSNWMNDASLTDVLFRILDLTVRPWRKREIAAIVASSKVSQMRSAHSRYVEYGDDVRDAADWLKMHVLVGVETLICMAVMFSGNRGAGTHDVNFILALVKKALKVFGLRYVLADKAYLAGTGRRHPVEVGHQGRDPDQEAHRPRHEGALLRVVRAHGPMVR
jgi:hypothetical protein